MHASITSLAWLHLNQLMYLLYNGTNNVTLFAPYEVYQLVCTQDPSNDREAIEVNMHLVMTFMTTRTRP